MIYSLDSNIILYSEGINDKIRQDVAHALIAAVGTRNLLVPVQAIGESFNGLIKRKKFTRKQAAALLAPWRHGVRMQNTTHAVLEAAVELATLHHFQIWDAVIVSAAAEGGASILFSEDMQNGFVWKDLIILNPFAESPDIIVQELLRNPSG